jgi:hypothetical protein
VGVGVALNRTPGLSSACFLAAKSVDHILFDCFKSVTTMLFGQCMLAAWHYCLTFPFPTQPTVPRVFRCLVSEPEFRCPPSMGRTFHVVLVFVGRKSSTGTASTRLCNPSNVHSRCVMGNKTSQGRENVPTRQDPPECVCTQLQARGRPISVLASFTNPALVLLLKLETQAGIVA